MQEIELAEKAIKGDEAAFLQLLEIQENAHYRIAYNYLKNEHDALEAIQEFTFRSFKKIHTVRKPQYINTWLVRVLINVCNDMIKKKKHIELRNEIEVGEHVDSINLDLADAIYKLSPEQQELIYLKYYRDLKNEEIANEVQIPEGTVKSRLHTALRKLRFLFSEGGQK